MKISLFSKFCTKNGAKFFTLIITKMRDKFVTNLVTNLITKFGDPQISHQI